jgi:hypothetical protein
MKGSESKSAHPAMPKTGAKDTGKNHDRTVKLGEGLNIGAVHSAHTKMKGGDGSAKENSSVQAKAHAANRRREAGGADPMGDCE